MGEFNIFMVKTSQTYIYMYMKTLKIWERKPYLWFSKHQADDKTVWEMAYNMLNNFKAF